MSSSFEIYSDNLIFQSKITASSENLLFPISNLLDSRRSKVFRSTNRITQIIFDFNETSQVDTVMLVDDKRNGFGISSLGIDFYATSSFASPLGAQMIDLNPQLGVGFKEFEIQEYRFARLNLESSLDYCELSKIFIGKKMDLGRSINFGLSIKYEDLSRKSLNRYGQIFVDVIRTQRVINCRLSLLDKDQMDKIFTWLDTYSEIRPFFVRIGCDNMTADNRRFSGMVYLQDNPQVTNSSFNRYDLSMTLVEAM